jgi:hypothetical protein
MAAVKGEVVGIGVFGEGEAILPVSGELMPLPARWLKVHRMRAYDTTLGREVYWDSGFVDTNGDDYEGPGPLEGVVCSKIFEGRYEV